MKHSIFPTVFLVAVSAQAFASSTAVTVRHFEVGVPITGTLGTVTTTCVADDWSLVANWGTGLRQITDHDAVRGGCGGGSCVHPSTAAVRDPGQVFTAAGDYTATLEVRIHCFGQQPGTYPYASSAPIKVWGRVPVKQLKAIPLTPPGGSKVRFTVTLSAPAPASNTRVDLTSRPEAFTDLPKFVVVPEKATEVEIEATLKSGLAVGSTVRVTATTSAQPARVTLTVR